MHVFISYADGDRQYISNLIIELKRLGISLWSNQDLLIGEDKMVRVQEQIQNCKAFIVLVSPHSISSKEIAKEVQVAERNKKIVAPILYGDLKERDLPFWIGSRTYADARNNRSPIAEIKRTLDAMNSSSSFSFEDISNQKRQTKKGHLSEQKIKLVKVPAGGRIDGNRIGIHPDNAFGSSYGLFTSFPNDTDNIRKKEISVKVLQEAEIPKGCLFIGEHLLDELGITEALDSSWDLQLKGLNVINVDQITLELTTETPIEQAVNELASTPNLMGHLIWLPNGLKQEQIIYINQEPYRIKEIFPTPKNTKTLLEIRSSTSLFLFSSGIKSGVDMVILADTSGSMGVPDLTEATEEVVENVRFSFLKRRSRSANQGVSRMHVLKKSLLQLLDMRLRIEGRVSKVALVSFTDNCSIRFPRKGQGMASLDGNSEAHEIQEFRSAIGLLQASGGTNIGKALHFAAELLYQHGTPENKRLIVLISDGASWTPKGIDSTGEVVAGVEDEVGLMENLYRTMNIHLHSIGISNLELFDKWVKKTGHSRDSYLIPNHDLLEELMIVGGGDISRIGNSNVIAEYFSGLGRGITRKVNNLRTQSIPPFQQYERRLMHEYKTEKEIIEEPIAETKKRAKLANEIWELVIDINGKSGQVTGSNLLNNDGLQFLSDIQKRTDHSQSFIVFIQKIRKSTIELSRAGSEEYPEEIKRKFRKSDDIQMLRAIERKLSEIKKPSQATPIELSDYIKDLIQVEVIKADEVKKWRAIQIAILGIVKSILSEIQDIYNEILDEQSTSSDLLTDTTEEVPMFTFMD